MVQSVGSALAPLQLGCGVPSGCEAAAHAARQYLESVPSNHVLLKVDFRNAFNSVRRDKILEAVKSSIPELFLFVSSAYSVPSYLVCGDSIILSEGVQQGDPLGPLLFCLTLHPLLSQLQSELKIFYLDDGTVGGSTESVLHDLHYLESGAAELGLHLNQSKSELICDDMFSRNVMLDDAPSLCYVSCSQATLLGSPIGGLECIDHTIEKVDMLERMGSRLHALSSHDALLLQHSFAIPKVLYVLRTAPCFLSPELARFDESLRHLVCVILNVPLDDNSAWLQASLPVRSGGIGIRRSMQLAPSVFLASAACCSELIPLILPPPLPTSSDPLVEEALSLWQATHDNPPPSYPSSHHQHIWDSAVVEASFNALMVSAPNTQSRARLLAVTCPESGAWLHPMPISSVGLRMDDDVRIAVSLRLGVPLCHPHMCSCCGAEVNNLGTYGLSCRFSKGRHSRHAALNDIIKRALVSARIPCHLVFIDQMVSVRMVRRWFHGGVARFWCGTPPVWTLLPPHTKLWQLESLGLLLWMMNPSNIPNTPDRINPSFCSSGSGNTWSIRS